MARRCEDMCKAALKLSFEKQVSDNMNIMGRLYWHGNVVPEMVLEHMAPGFNK
jgi:hypothetical protein